MSAAAAAGGAAAAAAAASHAEENRKLLALLKDRGADRPSRAEALTELEKKDRKRVDALLEKGMLAKGPDGRIYLTAKGIEASRKPEVNGGQVMLIMLVTFSLIASIVAIVFAVAD
ncbi:hypothetical protein [Sphingomicrobium flavum]|uniref:hypothetical protein n=1 Tax=Sphingomicrobium flavum TaxID=1229164 RepID=UPI0021AE1A02|nr:hypothetical protein [Sphingomicrobium flavum]